MLGPASHDFRTATSTGGHRETWLTIWLNRDVRRRWPCSGWGRGRTRTWTTTPSVVELRNQIDQLVAGEITPARVELRITQDLGPWAAAEDRHDPTPSPDRPTTPGRWDQFDPDGPLLTAQVVREERITELAMIANLAGYVAIALQRAWWRLV